ncbi:MAG TPA: TonB-dependent receptor [Terriglobales bacterium]|nr:TonB-dependent receptor [Terriglobales bacterium]
MSLRTLVLLFALAIAGLAQNARSLQGQVRDALGRAVPGARVEATDAHGAVLAQTATDAQGRYRLAAPLAATRLEASHAGLAPAAAPLSPQSAGALAPLVLGLATVEATVNVTALNLPLPAAQVGNATSTISGNALRRLNPLQAAAALRLEPGLGVIQSGQTGGVTSVFLRGAPGDFTKVLLDGVPIQRLDLGGYDFSNLAPVGLDEIQILRGPDSVVYGSDAAAGVIALRTRRGDQVERPEFDSTTEFGAYATAVQDNQLLGHDGAFDYALRYGYLNTRNQQPGAHFRDNTYGAQMGWRPTRTGVLRLALQRSYADTGQPNALLFYGLSEGAFKHQAETYADLSWRQQVTPAWSQRIEFTQSQANLFSEIPGPAGVPDGAGDFDGLPVTIQGANGFAAQGRAILSFGGVFPQLSPSDTLRRDLSWESEFTLNPHWSLIEGYRYYDERGLSSTDALSRHDHGAYALLRGSLGNRLFGSGGLAADRNTPFGFTANPQASLAGFPRLGNGGFWDETRLRASGGTGLKDPSLVDEEFSLYQELFSAPGGAALIRQFGLAPMRPQRSRDFDMGVDQYLAGGAGELSATVFDQRYYDLIEDIPTTAFPALGIPAAVAQRAAFGGEFNSLTERARGLELEAKLRLGRGWRLQTNYTATAATVLRSFSFDAQAPSFNPAFPALPIGAFAPLVGGRPFRVPRQSASLLAGYARGRFSGQVWGSWLSRRDDSTFLTDSNFGNTLLLPNHNLDPAYWLANFSGAWQLRPGLRLLAAVDNIFNRSYQEVIGYPGPKISARVGVRWSWSPPLPH